MEKKEIIDLVHDIHDICFKLMDSINADDLVLQINKKVCEEIDKRWEEIKEDKDVQM